MSETIHDHDCEYRKLIEEVCPDYIAGEPMVCEQHPWRLWPSRDEGCAGPGMPLSGAQPWPTQDLDAARAEAVADERRRMAGVLREKAEVYTDTYRSSKKVLVFVYEMFADELRDLARQWEAQG